jgi:hypothetical protein
MDNSLEVRDAQWSSKSSFLLPSWYGVLDWKTGYRKLWLNGISESEGNKNEFEIESWKAFQEFLTNAKIMNLSRYIIYVPVNAKGNKQLLWSEILDAFDLRIPSWNVRFEPIELTNGSVPHLAICLDRKSNEIESQTTFLVPHWESLGFLELFLYSCRKFSAERSPQILVIDDGSSQATYDELLSICAIYGAEVKQLERLDKGKVADVGAVLDFGIKFVRTKYVCMLDADVVLINAHMIANCAAILEDNSVVSIGLDTSLADEYHSNLHWGKNKVIKSYGKQLPGYLSVTNNLFRFMRTDDAKAVSQNCGFARANSERKLRDQIGRIIRRLSRQLLSTHKNLIVNDLINSKMLNSRYPVMPPTCDNGVAANAWMDQNMMGVKFNYPITSYGILTEKDGVAFQNISDLLVHIALSTRALSDSRREVDDAGEKYYAAIKNIVERATSLEERFSTVVKLSLNIRNS